jgi:hypothetical protein
MHPGEDDRPAGGNPWAWRALACLLILGAAALRLAYLAYGCPLT